MAAVSTICCANARTLSLIIGWIHLILSGLMAIALLINLCVYHNKTYEDTILEEEVLDTGLPTLIFLFLFTVASLVFDIMLLKGISQERVKLMSPFVYGNYVALGILTVLALYNFVSDIIHGSTFGDIMIHIVLHALTIGTMIFFFYPVYEHYHQLRFFNEQPEQQQLNVNRQLPPKQQSMVDDDAYADNFQQVP